MKVPEYSLMYDIGWTDKGYAGNLVLEKNPNESDLPQIDLFGLGPKFFESIFYIDNKSYPNQKSVGKKFIVPLEDNLNSSPL